jgi:SAM-dependent methyltransferase
MVGAMSESQGIRGPSADLYDVFVDWKGRLGREMPGLRKSLRAVEARRVLDVGCGTGRHVEALLEEGFDAHGSDLSEEMLAKSRAPAERMHLWRLGDDPPESVSRHAPFDAVISLGNVWTQLTDDGEIERCLVAIRGLLRPGGMVLVGLKAFAVRREEGDPYLPLLARDHEGERLLIVRFVDFEDPESDLCRFYMQILREDGEAAAYWAGPVRAWDPATLRESFESAGFVDVAVSASLGDRDAPPAGEDVFVHARMGS